MTDWTLNLYHMPQSNIYGVDIYKIGRSLVPKGLKKTKLLILLQAALNPWLFGLDNLSRYRTAKLYQLSITTQVCYLQKMLNDRYDLTLRRILIDKSQPREPWFIYQEAELKPQYVYQESENNPVWVYSDNEAGTVTDDFVVFVPAAVSFNEDEMRSLLDAYKLFGKHYKIALI